MTSHRADRVADRVREILATTIRAELRDPRLGFVTVTGVRLSSDLRHATVFVAAHGDEEQRDATLGALRRASPFLRRTLAQEAGLRHVPELRFESDPGVESGFRVESLLREIADDEEKS